MIAGLIENVVNGRKDGGEGVEDTNKRMGRIYMTGWEGEGVDSNGDIMYSLEKKYSQRHCKNYVWVPGGYWKYQGEHFLMYLIV